MASQTNMVISRRLMAIILPDFEEWSVKNKKTFTQNYESKFMAAFNDKRNNFELQVASEIIGAICRDQCSDLKS
ncbi:unnamed protein product [Brachionus calyciflorus]|uniref:Uncharacterized protein n=1 Tax=Brachionus calyciflorus TaxID=104777 RepID=A0A814PU72_9BILA|nr:unnamed protein product [Brachionus calyciflorus]